ncbi:triacylglycerol lipase 2-like [Coffea eugenioides]|uniref:triacylglycerol lipase 2-like n=1 Tax=Coffea eugenioides TaxID=49369 RepID=UPI000F611F55|nr:triacylglycerol lipase 2-like [Coffea eugenioides]
MASTITHTVLAVLLCVLAVVARTNLDKQSSDFNLSKILPLFDEDGICNLVVEKQGYVCQEHKVITKDGYILSLQRIPEGRAGKAANKIPVLLQHGLLMDAVSWMINSPDESLAFILADNGFDVWLANTRGTNYSRGHTSIDPNDPSYWDWSWDELVAYDLPATVQYVHDQTGQKLHYVGHSLGTLIAFAAFSQEKLLNSIRSAALLSPIAYLAQMSSFLAKTAADAFIAEDLYWLGIKEFAPRGEAAVKLLEDICKNPENNCSDLMTSFTCRNCCVNSSKTNDFLDHEPQSTATKNMIHLAQMIRQGTIAMYDYGSADENNKHYGQPTPPVYNMSSIPKNLPLFLSYGGQDYLSDVDDVKTLLNALKDHDADKLFTQYREDYAHADFVFGENAKQVVYDPLMAFFKLQ